ncbi:MAG: HNH endonuclease [Stigonema ocellatum SAG 48.90 = DSM 106950]|nr:HNH endonuclease [Stigonema ocellatum SAG 48.90 = DSM 106950]
MDIAGCFDNISHTKLMEAIMLPQAFKTGVFRCLKAGLDVRFNDDTERGTPQGGIISPTLANIALNDLDNLPIFTKDPKVQKVRLIRYADDMIAIIKPGLSKDYVKKVIENELHPWGLELKASKTRFSSPTDGFDFLGWHCSTQANNGKFRSTPYSDNFRKFRRKVKDIVNRSGLSTEAKATKLSSIVRGWREYHKYCDMTNHSLWHLAHATWKKFWRDKNSSTKKATELISIAFPTVDVKQAGHIKVEGKRSPYDGSTVYWTDRNSKLYKGLTSTVLKRQNFRCGKCNLRFNGDEKVHLHHNDGNHGNNKLNNLTALHESCHDYIHMGKRKSK